jgi:hypothetical protein
VTVADRVPLASVISWGVNQVSTNCRTADASPPETCSDALQTFAQPVIRCRITEQLLISAGQKS